METSPFLKPIHARGNDETTKPATRKHYLLTCGLIILAISIAFAVTSGVLYRILASELSEQEVQLSTWRDKVKNLQKQMLVPSNVSGSCEEDLKACQSDTADLEGSIKNLENTLAQLYKSIDTIKLEIEKAQRRLDTCTYEKRACSEELANLLVYKAELQQTEKKLGKVIDSAAVLSLEMVKQTLYQREAKAKYDYNLIFNCTSGCTKSDLLNNLAKNYPLVFFFRTTDYRFFGASTSVPWPETIGFASDPLAFTFSSTKGKICPVKDHTKAIKNVESNLLQFGDTEIAIGFRESSSHTNPGEAVADTTYTCNVARDFFSFW